jgi:hypothetical protein
MNQLVFLVLILIIAIGLPLFFKINESYRQMRKDGFSNYNLEGAMGPSYPNSDLLSDLLVKDFYPPTGRLGISNNGSAQTWWHYPTFTLGSYKQITNNIRYSNNPDLGSCMPDSMCGALYHERQLKSNYIKPLPPLNPNCGTRVGYFDTYINLLPVRTDTQNILY